MCKGQRNCKALIVESLDDEQKQSSKTKIIGVLPNDYNVSGHFDLTFRTLEQKIGKKNSNFPNQE